MREYFVAGTPARTAAALAGVNRNTARLFYHRMRELIAWRLAQVSPFKGDIEIDAACFDTVSGDAQGRSAASQLPLFVLLKRGGRIYTAMVPEARPESPPQSIAKVRPDSLVFAGSPGDRAVLDVAGLLHLRVNHRKRPAGGRAHFDGIENFWSQAKRNLRQYNGIPRRHFDLFLKECEWRVNYAPPKNLLKTLKRWMKPDAGRTLSMPARPVNR